jgi:opacity protein-like surface antigen
MDFSKPKALIHGSLGIPSTPDTFSEGSSLGFGGGIGLGMYVTPSLMLAVTAEFLTFGADADGLRKIYDRPNDAVLGGETSIFYGAFTTRFDPFRLRYFRPYLMAGFGFHRFVPDDVQFDNLIVDRDAQTSFGVHGGLGVDVSFGSVINVFVEAAYIAGFTSGETTGVFPLRGGLMFELSPDSEEQ